MPSRNGWHSGDQATLTARLARRGADALTASVVIPRDQKVLCRRRLRGFAVIRVQQPAEELLALYHEIPIRHLVRAIPRQSSCRAALRYSIVDPLMRTVPVEESDIGPHVVVTWAWNRPEPFCCGQRALGMILDLGSMRPRCRHNDGGMASGGVRVQCATEREGEQRAAGRRS